MSVQPCAVGEVEVEVEGCHEGERRGKEADCMLGYPQEAIHWRYRAEGGHNLVIVNSQEHVVYRLLKRCTKAAVQTAQIFAESREQYLEDGINYVKYVITPKVGHQFINPGKLVKLPPGFISDISQQLELQRPVHRLNKELDPECKHALCLPDLCQLSPCINHNHEAPTFSVEIKPKCGFLPSAHLDLSRTIKYSVCKFCLYQPFKLKNGSRREISCYCPLDLFSGEPTRMRHSLNMLFQTPHNNMRLFKNGKLIHSEELKSEFYKLLQPHFSSENDSNENVKESILDNFVDVLLKCLLASPEQAGGGDVSRLPSCRQTCRCSIYRSSDAKTTDNGVEASLPYGCVLYQILRLQLMDRYDIEHIYPIYLRMKKLFDLHPEMRKASGIDGPYSSDFWERHVDGDLIKIIEFLAAQTAKDCSIIAAIQPCPQSNGNGVSAMMEEEVPNHQLIRDKSGRLYRFSVSVIDWDRKPIDRISKYFIEEGDVIQHFEHIMR